MESNMPFASWQDVLSAPHSQCFHDHPTDTVFDRAKHEMLSAEALFTQSNTRVLLGHAANGMLRMVALPTQVYAAATGPASSES